MKAIHIAVGAYTLCGRYLRDTMVAGEKPTCKCCLAGGMSAFTIKSKAMKKQVAVISLPESLNERPQNCTLPDDELLKRCSDWITKLCHSGGDAWCLRVPVDFEHDPDMLFIELINRYKQTLTNEKRI